MSFTPTKQKLLLVPPGDAEAYRQDALAAAEEGGWTLRQLLERHPAPSASPIPAEWLDRPISQFRVRVGTAEGGAPLYDPPISRARRAPAGASPGAPADGAVKESIESGPGMSPNRAPAAAPPPVPSPAPAEGEGGRKPVYPEKLDNQEAVRLAYRLEIERVASFLRAELPVLVTCDKGLVRYLWRDILRKAGKEADERRTMILTVPDEAPNQAMPSSLRQRQLMQLKAMIRDLKRGEVLVIPHLDLLAGGSDNNLAPEARELTELLYNPGPTADETGPLLLAFADRSLVIPDVLASRFAVRVLISDLPREVIRDGQPTLIGEALVTAAEAARFRGYDPAGLFKNVAGMGPILLRQALSYAMREHEGDGELPVSRLYAAIRAFKAQTTARFEVPDVTFQQIGGYADVKQELVRALHLLQGSYKLDEKLQRELIPRGFIFYGPPGTGKTLFAKAIANYLNATVLVVSGPEITDMYVGESERKVRELFAQARRNAPAVLVFDEFDSIASQRSGRDDGGSRANNAVVAQILTEMDGFRPDVPMLVIGTTNRLDIIDEALLRPARFQAVKIDLPDRPARRAIAAVHARHFNVEVPEALLELVAGATEGFNGDEIRSIFRDACVGLYCQEPRQEVDARRLGQLVGRVELARQQRSAEKARTQRRSAAEPVRPTGAMVPLAQPAGPTAPTAPLAPLTAPAERPAPAAPAPPGPARAGPVYMQTSDDE